MHSNVGRARRAPVLRIKNRLAAREWRDFKSSVLALNGAVMPWIHGEVTIIRLPRADQLETTARLRSRHNAAKRRH